MFTHYNTDEIAAHFVARPNTFSVLVLRLAVNSDFHHPTVIAWLPSNAKADGICIGALRVNPNSALSKRSLRTILVLEQKALGDGRVHFRKEPYTHNMLQRCHTHEDGPFSVLDVRDGMRERGFTVPFPA
ncbi:hypothetical protein TrVFT333_001050 [Trichoderma virens FT-333]|nr:hypothetical protein TrVFT333_001050 [Trichoderma virens FT-333]